MKKREKVFFKNSSGVRLCGIIELPPADLRATALFTHCFTCTKDLKAIVRISRKLAEQGIAVLRFDFTGLGESGGSFSDSNFDTNCRDVLAAERFLAGKIQPPQLLIGHSLGGGALISTADQIESARALVTIASPSTTQHLADYLSQSNPDILSKGGGTVEIGGRSYLLKRQLIDKLRQQDLPAKLRQLEIAHLIFHPLEDDTLPYWHAGKMFELTGGPKSLITLDRSDHLLVTRREDCDFVANTIAGWFYRSIANG